jgi:hypothetical protein
LPAPASPIANAGQVCHRETLRSCDTKLKLLSVLIMQRENASFLASQSGNNYIDGYVLSINVCHITKNLAADGHVALISAALQNIPLQRTIPGAWGIGKSHHV